MRETTIKFVKKFSHDDPNVLRETREILTRLTAAWRRTAGSPLADRVAALYPTVDAEIAAVNSRVSIPIPCTRGCNHCCKFNEIYVTTYEAILLVRHIESLGAGDKAQVTARIRATTSKSGGGNASPCVLLTDPGCSVYSSRPLPCRGYYSLSEPACNDRLNRGGGNPPNLAAARVVEFAALEVSQAAKRPPFEINTLLHRIYADPAKVARWASGQPTDESDLAIAADA